MAPSVKSAQLALTSLTGPRDVALKCARLVCLGTTAQVLVTVRLMALVQQGTIVLREVQLQRALSALSTFTV